MTGANRFTRAAGACGLAATAIGVALLVLFVVAIAIAQSSGPEHYLDDAVPRNAAVLLATVMVGFGLAIACSLVNLAGILVRHRDRWWVRFVVCLLVLTVAAWLGSRGSGSAQLLGVATFVTLGVGMFAANEMPRRASAAVVVGALGDLLPRTSELAPTSALVGAVGFTLVSWTMWREPLGEEAVPAPAPA